MADPAAQRRLMIRYLLGELSPEERAALEERYFGDDELFDELVCLENEIVDTYVQGELSENERKRFESHFLVTPERQEKVRFAKSLLNQAKNSGVASDIRESTLDGGMDQRKSASETLVSFSFLRTHGLLAVFVALVATSVWLFVGNRPRREPTQQQADIQPTDTGEC